MNHRQGITQTQKSTGYTPQVMFKIAMTPKVKISAVQISRLLLQVIDYWQKHAEKKTCLSIRTAWRDTKWFWIFRSKTSSVLLSPTMTAQKFNQLNRITFTHLCSPAVSAHRYRISLGSRGIWFQSLATWRRPVAGYYWAVPASIPNFRTPRI